MSKSIVKQSQGLLFQQTWLRIVEQAAHGLKLTEKERKWLVGSPVAKYVAAIPYAASCRNPDRMALMLLALFVVEIRGGSPFDARPSDMNGSLERIEPYFEPLYASGGDPQIIDKGKYLLGMKTLSHWIEEPDAHPSSTDFVPLRYKLKVKIEELPPNELLDGILTVDDGMINTWW